MLRRIRLLNKPRNLALNRTVNVRMLLRQTQKNQTTKQTMQIANILQKISQASSCKLKILKITAILCEPTQSSSQLLQPPILPSRHKQHFLHPIRFCLQHSDAHTDNDAGNGRRLTCLDIDISCSVLFPPKCELNNTEYVVWM